MFKLSIHRADELDKNVKATLQATGRLGFSESAMKKMKLEGGKFLVLASNEEDTNDQNLYAWVEDDDKNGGFRINKAGEYMNVNTKPLFDKLGIDYRDRSTVTIYDILDFNHEGRSIFKLVKRVQPRSTKNRKTDEVDS